MGNILGTNLIEVDHDFDKIEKDFVIIKFSSSQSLPWGLLDWSIKERTAPLATASVIGKLSVVIAVYRRVHEKAVSQAIKAFMDRSRDLDLSISVCTATEIKAYLPRLFLRVYANEQYNDGSFKAPNGFLKVMKRFSGGVIVAQADFFSMDRNGGGLNFPTLYVAATTFRDSSSKVTIDKSKYHPLLALNQSADFLFQKSLKKPEKANEDEADDEPKYVPCPPGCYIQKGFMGKHAALPAAAFTEFSLSDFNATREGIYAEIFNAINRYGYLQLQQRPLSGTYRRITKRMVAEDLNSKASGIPETIAIYRDISIPSSQQVADMIASSAQEMSPDTLVTSVERPEDADVVITRSILTADDIPSHGVDPKEQASPYSQTVNIEYDDFEGYPDKKLKSLRAKCMVSLLELSRKHQIRRKTLVGQHVLNIPYAATAEFPFKVKGESRYLVASVEVTGENISFSHRVTKTKNTDFMNGSVILDFNGQELTFSPIDKAIAQGFPEKKMSRILSVFDGGDPMQKFFETEELKKAIAICDAPEDEKARYLEALSSPDFEDKFWSRHDIQAEYFLRGGKKAKEGAFSNLSLNRQITKLVIEENGVSSMRSVHNENAEFSQHIHTMFVADEIEMDGEYSRIYHAYDIDGIAKQVFEKFGRLYRVSSYEPIPDTVFNLFEDYTVRLKRPTVFPYIFKYLREYSEIVRKQDYPESIFARFQT